MIFRVTCALLISSRIVAVNGAITIGPVEVFSNTTAASDVGLVAHEDHHAHAPWTTDLGYLFNSRLRWQEENDAYVTQLLAYPSSQWTTFRPMAIEYLSTLYNLPFSPEDITNRFDSSLVAAGVRLP